MCVNTRIQFVRLMIPYKTLSITYVKAQALFASQSGIKNAGYANSDWRVFYNVHPKFY